MHHPDSSAVAQKMLELLRNGHRGAYKHDPSKMQFCNELLAPHRKGLRPAWSNPSLCEPRNSIAEDPGVPSKPADLALSRETGTCDLYLSDQVDPLLGIGLEPDSGSRGSRVSAHIPVEREPSLGGSRHDGTGCGDHAGVGARIENTVDATPVGGRSIITNHESMINVSVQALVFRTQLLTAHPRREVGR